MFLHSGASLHGHEYSNRSAPSTPNSPPRKKPYLRSAYARPRPFSDIFSDRSHPPVVRFKEPESEQAPSCPRSLCPTPMMDDEPSVYDSDNSQTSGPSARRKKRRVPRKSTAYMFALPAPKAGARKHILKSIRPRLLYQLQELPAGKRSRPVIDVYPAALIAGPLVTARYIHRFPHIFGVKGELGPRDRILLRSEDYDSTLADNDSDDEIYSKRRELLAVFSPVRGQDCEEIILDDGTAWTAKMNNKGGFDFTHVDVHGITTTVRWVKREAQKANAGSSTPYMLSPSSTMSSLPTGRLSTPPDPDYKYIFSVINPLSRRHPVLATLTPTSLEVNEDYTTVSSFQGCHPPTRPMSFADLEALPPVDELSAERQIHEVNDDTKKLITVTALWLSMRHSPQLKEVTEHRFSQDSHAQQRAISPPPNPPPSALPRRQTTGTPNATPRHTPSLRRAMSTGASFMQRRIQRQALDTDICEEAELRDVKGAEARHVKTDVMSESDSRNGNGRANENEVPAQQKPSRRVSWLRMLVR